MKFGVVVFPGSNCDHDAWYAVSNNPRARRRIHLARFHQPRQRRRRDSARRILLWRLSALRRHRQVLAGDAARSQKFAADGGLVLGICNGFQILVEAGLLPGALLRNRGLNSSAAKCTLRVETTELAVHLAAQHRASCCAFPIAHGEGCYFADERTLDRTGSRRPRGVALCRQSQRLAARHRGHLNRERNVMGMMPHPERACDPLMGSTDGLVIFESMVRPWLRARKMTITPELDRTNISSRPRSTRKSSRCSAASPLHRARHLQRDVERALLLQKLAPSSEEAAHARQAACCRGRAKTPASSISATATRSRSRSNRTIIPVSSSRFRARPPASAAFCATFSPWARGPSR